MKIMIIILTYQNIRHMMKTMKKENNNITSNETVIDDNTSIDTGY